MDKKKDKDLINQIYEEYYKPLNEDFMNHRFHKDSEDRLRPDGEYHRDYTRIMYSSSFRRLQGKMQLLGIKNDQFHRNRLTHSLEVAQIARSIANDIGYSSQDIYVVEAGAFAHDIGNPPFGHHGEKVLNDLSKSFGGFEGNAQSLRILTTLERKRTSFSGLNLTVRTLLSVVKYFNTQTSEHNISKFIYNEDYKLLNQFIIDNNIKVRTLDVQIIDIADEIAYAAHDLEDGLRQHKFTIEDILYTYKSKYGNTESYNELVNLVDDAKGRTYQKNDRIGTDDCTKLFIKEIASSIINLLIKDIGLVEPDGDKKVKTKTQWDKELGFRKYGELAKGLKEITFSCITETDEVYLYEQEGTKIIEFLYNLFKKNPNYLPSEYRKNRDFAHDEQKRLIIDYISGMMDSYAISAYNKFNKIYRFDK